MVQVTIGTETKEFPQGTTWAQVAAQYQEQYENDILLVQINGKLQELHKTVRSGNVHFITAEEKPGMSAYQRSATLLLLKAPLCGSRARNRSKRQWWIFLWERASLWRPEAAFP